MGFCATRRISHKVKMHYFFKNLLLYSLAKIRITKSKVIMTKEGSTKIVNFMIPGTGVHVLGHGHIEKMQYFFFSSCLHLGMDQTY